MEIIISKEEILKLASKLKSSKGRTVKTMRYSMTVDIQPDTDIFKKNIKPKKSDNSSFIQDCYNTKCYHYHKSKMCKKYVNTDKCNKRVSSPK